MRHRHGADDLVSGERYNLIMWNKSSSYRLTRDFMSKYQRAPDADAAPDLVCLSYTHDDDYEEYKVLPAAQFLRDSAQFLRCTRPLSGASARQEGEARPRRLRRVMTVRRVGWWHSPPPRSEGPSKAPQPLPRALVGPTNAA